MYVNGTLNVACKSINFTFANAWKSTYIRLIMINSEKLSVSIRRYIQFTIDTDRNV